MKNLVLVFPTLVGFAFTSNAQEKKKKNAKHDIEVLGNCDMCKKRIEKAAYAIKGVKSAEWHSEDQTLHVIIDENKTSTTVICEAVAKVGHDTGEVRATDEDYAALHTCCVYERKAE